MALYAPATRRPVGAYTMAYCLTKESNAYACFMHVLWELLWKKIYICQARELRDGPAGHRMVGVGRGLRALAYMRYYTQRVEPLESRQQSLWWLTRKIAISSHTRRTHRDSDAGTVATNPGALFERSHWISYRSLINSEGLPFIHFSFLNFHRPGPKLGALSYLGLLISGLIIWDLYITLGPYQWWEVTIVSLI